MSKITKIKLTNFKRFASFEVSFDENLNILIGDNEAGKSSILTAIDLVLSGSRNKVETVGLENLFNIHTIEAFLQGNKQYENLPEILVELYLSEQNNPSTHGRNNSDNVDCDGLKLICKPSDEYSCHIAEIINDNDSPNFPFEFYSIELKTFADEPYNSYNKFLKNILVDNSQVSSEYALKEYIRDIYSSNLANSIERHTHQHQYRSFKDQFKRNAFGEINQRLGGDIHFAIRTSHKSNLESDLAIMEGSINIENKGKGKLCFVKTELALKRAGNDLQIVLIEEPENHLSHVNMKRLIQKISEADDKQIFIATHSDMISSRLDLRKVILVNSNDTRPLTLSTLPDETARFFIKAPDKNILEFILSKKVILVEGDAEYILMEYFYKKTTGRLPENDGIHIIAVDGKTFKRYLDISNIINIKTAVLTDNDHNYAANITTNYANYNAENIGIYSDDDNARYTLEVCIYNDNQVICDGLFGSGRRTLTVQDYMLKNKAEVALRILENGVDNITIPNYILAAITWIND